jgi:hypothetical protein
MIKRIAFHLVDTVDFFQDSPYPSFSLLSGACRNIQPHNTGGVRNNLDPDLPEKASLCLWPVAIERSSADLQPVP